MKKPKPKAINNDNMKLIMTTTIVFDSGTQIYYLTSTMAAAYRIVIHHPSKN